MFRRHTLWTVLAGIDLEVVAPFCLSTDARRLVPLSAVRQIRIQLVNSGAHYSPQEKRSSEIRQPNQAAKSGGSHGASIPVPIE